MNESASPQPPRKLPDEPVLRPHTYDGIQEYDQKLPNWWLFTLYIMIVYSVIMWFLNYQTFTFKGDRAEIDKKLAVIDAAKAEQLNALLSQLDDKILWEMSRDESVVEAGKATFEGTCVACHAADLTGMLNGVKLPGENLVDPMWKYGGSPMHVFHTVTKGSPNLQSGMIPWEPTLGAKKCAELVAYIMSHHDESEPGVSPNDPGTGATPAPAPAPSPVPAPAAPTAPDAPPSPAPAPQ